MTAAKQPCRQARQIRFLLLSALLASGVAAAQAPPRADEVEGYTDLLRAVAHEDAAVVRQLLSAGTDVNVRDAHGRTALMVAGYTGDAQIAELLIEHGADVNALDAQHYDILTITAVLNDIELVVLALDSGADSAMVTSPYQGTALIAAAHLGHVEVVRALLRGGAPVDHVNNLGWTALIEAIVLGDGGRDYQTIVRELITAGADPNLADGEGARPLALARRYRFQEIERILADAGAEP